MTPVKAVCVAALLANSLLLAPGAAQAQERDPAAAEALFRQGREAAEKGDHRTACAKFEESNRLDPAVGTIFNIADCQEKLGNVATAWTRFREVLDKLKPGDERRPIAEGRAKALEPRLPRLAVRFEGPRPEGTEVTRDGVVLRSASFDVPVPVDPGERVVRVTAPGHEPVVKKVNITEGSSETVVVGVGPETRAGSGSRGTEGSGGGSVGVDTTGGGSPTLGWVIGGVGALGLGVGAVTGIMALGKKSTVDDNCDADKQCNQQGFDAAEDGRTLTTISTIGWVAGVVGVGVGAYFILSSDDDGRATAVGTRALPGGGAVSLSGRF